MPDDSLLSEVNSLFEQQIKSWNTVASRYQYLNEVKSKELTFPHCSALITYNPSRSISATAKVDPQSIRQRACFLCAKNRPPEQVPLSWNNYHIQVNPFPIFKQHFTIVEQEHCPQLLSPERIHDMLVLARALPDYTIFYNGPSCGASAPDHFHFQAGNRHYMPIEQETDSYAELLGMSPEVSIKYHPNELREVLILESNSIASLTQTVSNICGLIGQVVPQLPEPMVNLLALYKNSHWRVYIFPRRAHRPAQFFEEGENKVLFSPGTVDCGGVIILPAEKDFEQMNHSLLQDMFKQVTFTPEQFSILKELIQTSVLC